MISNPSKNGKILNRDSEHSLWTEKYRPKELDEYIGNEAFKEAVAKYIRRNDVPNIILYGPPGTGKTSAAKLICGKVKCKVLYLNASDDNGIDTVRNTIKNFASVACAEPLKIAIIDDAYNFTVDAQQALLNMIETYSKKTRFIFTTNHLEKLIDALQSRCKGAIWKIEALSKHDVGAHLTSILEQEGVEYVIEDVARIVKRYYPDIRGCIKGLQECVSDEKKLIVNFDNLKTSSYLCSILETLKTPTKDAWTTIRQIIADADITDYTEVFKYLYNTADQFAKKGYEETIFAISQAQYQQYFVPDREINAAEMFLKILRVIK